MVFLFIILGLPVLDGLWWWWADRRLRRTRSARKARWWRIALAAFMMFQLGDFLATILSRGVGWYVKSGTLLQSLLLAWHLLILPLTMVVLGLVEGGRAALRFGQKIVKSTHAPAPNITPEPDPPDLSNLPGPAEGLSRRQFLTAAAVAAPPLLAMATTGVSLFQLAHFRVRHIDVNLPALPEELDGLVIAHVSDSHVGQLTHGPLLRRIVQAVNAMDADLVLFTGDLINDSLSYLPAGVEMLQQMQSRFGMLAIEGNHDLFEGRDAFERPVRSAGIHLLLDEAETLTVRGQRLQVLGIQWGGLQGAHRGAFEEHFARVRPLLRSDAFPILLSHHPDTFDLAAAAGIPLTLSGHTHGGQLMLTEHLGPGPLMFKYWSGLYTKGNCATVVSNGVGNWFPLRLNAPAEIARLTLRRRMT